MHLYRPPIMAIIRAQLEQLDAVARLFDDYRVFYGQPTDRAAAADFLRARLQQQDSVIFAAVAAAQVVGFTQLYPSFSSVSLQRIWILNDLYVAASDRRQGWARQLLQAAATFAQSTGAIRLVLATQAENTAAQTLYESLGYQQNTEFHHYALLLKPQA
ncbi:MAG: GNAT family N-acetyltransferase [Cyanobacteria bacterium P01_D01_bin.115]